MRTWQTAHVMKRRRGCAARRRRAPTTMRARRYVAKYTICPAIAHGLDARGRLGRGRQARRPRAVGPGVLRRHARTSCIKGGHDRLGRRWATPTPRSRRRSRCCPARCSARSGAAAGRDSRRLRRPGGDRGRPGRPARRCAGGSCRSPTPAASARPTCRENDALPAHRGRPRHVRRAHRRRARRAEPRPPSCRWPSATSCSDARPMHAPRRAAAARRRPASRPAATRTPAALEAAVGAGRVTDAGRRWRRSCAAGCTPPAWSPRRSPPRPRAAPRRPTPLARARRRGSTPGRRRPRCARPSRGSGRAAAAGRPRRPGRPAARRARGRAARPHQPVALGAVAAARRAATPARPRCVAALRRGHRPGQRRGAAARPRPVRGARAARRAWPPTCDAVAADAAAAAPHGPLDDLPAAQRPAARHRRRAPRHLGGAALCILTRTTTATDERPHTHPRPGRRPRTAPLPRRPRRAARRHRRAGRLAARPRSSPRCAGRCADELSHRRRHQRHLHHRGRRLPAARRRCCRPSGSLAVETGCCPHTAIRDDIAANLDAVEDLEDAARPARPGARRERRRQPHRDVQPRAWSTADLRHRRGRRRQGAAQGRPRRDHAPTCW